MSILRRVGTTQEEREAYLEVAGVARRRLPEGLSDERWAELAEKEQFLLTVTENGYGKRTSTYEYRRTNRGGQGIINIVTSERNGGVVASFPVKPGEQLMLVTDQAQDHPHHGRRHPHYRSQHARRDHLPRRRQRACRQRREDRRERRGRNRA